MGTEEKPDIKVEFFDGDQWVDIFGETKRFVIKDGVMVRIPSILLEITNFDGKHTGAFNWSYSSDFKNQGIGIGAKNKLKVKVDTRGIEDLVFYGWLETRRGNPEVYLRDFLTLEGYHWALRLLRDSKTKNYKDLGTTIENAIRDMLDNPDSETPIPYSLLHDSKGITSEVCPENLENTVIFDALRRMLEECGYDGWFDVDESTEKLLLNLYSVGGKPTSPYLTLKEPFVEIEPEVSKEEVKNVIFVYGDKDIGKPRDQDYCERNILSNWQAGNADTTLTEESRIRKVGSKAVKVTVTVTLGVAETAEGRFTIPSLDSPIDASTGRFSKVGFYNYFELDNLDNEGYCPTIKLRDTNGNVINFDPDQKAENKKWYWTEAPLGEGAPFGVGRGVWEYETGTTFNWRITSCRIGRTFAYDGTSSIIIDGLVFIGGLEIDPFKYPKLNPKITDQESINWLGYPSVYHFTAQRERIKTFEEAQVLGKLLVTVLKKPFRTIKVRVPPKPYVKPGQYLDLTLSKYGIFDEQWRITEHSLRFERRRLWSILTLVPRYDQYAFEKLSETELAGILASMQRL